MNDLDRVRWRCRRGLMELEIILERFLTRHYANLSRAERNSFSELLGQPDAELWALVDPNNETGPALADPLQSRLIELLRRC